jgi:hypothetical protein
LPITLGSDKALGVNQTVYPPLIKLDVPMNLNQFAVSAGNMAQTANLDISQIQNWSTRFAALFDEYAVVGFKGELRVNSCTTPSGFISVAIDEKSSATPTVAILNSARLDIACTTTEYPNKYHINWVARDYTDLVWTDVGTTLTPAYIKFWAQPASTGTQTSTAATLLLSGTLALCLRGYRNH